MCLNFKHEQIQGSYVFLLFFFSTFFLFFTWRNGKTEWRSVHVAQLAVDVLQDLGVGLVLGGVAAQGALRGVGGGRGQRKDGHASLAALLP